MKSSYKLLNDLQTALFSTLEINLQLESMMAQTFHKKTSAKSTKKIQWIGNELWNIQDVMEKQGLIKGNVKKNEERGRQRSLTPVKSRELPMLGENCLKKYLKVSNKKVCSSRTGHFIEELSNTERNIKFVHNQQRLYKRYSKGNSQLFKKKLNLQHPEGFLNFQSMEFKKVKSDQNGILRKQLEIKFKKNIN